MFRSRDMGRAIAVRRWTPTALECYKRNISILEGYYKLYPMLLKLIDESKTKSKTAHWVSAISYVDGEEEICKQESISGKMCSCRGDRKFGFDQYFEPEGKNKTLSELLPEEKDEIGPRKKAFLEVLEKIK